MRKLAKRLVIERTKGSLILYEMQLHSSEAKKPLGEDEVSKALQQIFDLAAQSSIGSNDIDGSNLSGQFATLYRAFADQVLGLLQASRVK